MPQMAAFDTHWQYDRHDRQFTTLEVILFVHIEYVPPGSYLHVVIHNSEWP